MANEEEMESFEVSEQDLQSAFNFKKTYKKNSKDQQIYGVFNYEEDDEPSSSNWSRSKKKLKGNDYTAPVGFVKGGLQEGSKNDKFSAKPKLVSISDSDEEDDQEQSSQTSTSRNLRARKSLGQIRNPSKFEADRKNNLGEWEKHTKGIGAKLLMQMGYQPGKGLGKSLQGRSQPVEAQVRKGRGAVGLYGTEIKNKPEKTVDSEDEEEKEYLEKLAHWKKGPNTKEDTKTKTHFLYRTSEEIIEEATKSGVHKMARDYSEISKAKVIDMTGREQRVLSGYSALGARKAGDSGDSDIPGINKDKFELEKLSYNLENLVNFCEQEIIENAKFLAFNQDQISSLESEMKNTIDFVSKERDQIQMLSNLVELLDQLENKRNDDTLNLDYLWEHMSRMELEYPEDFISYDMPQIILTYLVPLVKKQLSQSWRPFESKSTDDMCRLTFLKWRPMLENRGKTSHKREVKLSVKTGEFSQMEPYHGLVFHAWLPVYRSVANQWLVKNAEPMVDLVETWESVLPSWILENILDQLILPKIQREVDNWNPLSDLIPIHAWIHPWLPKLGSKLEIVYPTIRQKMAQALVARTPSDASAKSVLLPWVSEFSRGAMDAFLIKNILPKLTACVKNWNINPSQQQLDVWHWVMNWKDLMPTQSIIQMLVDNFFPRWLHVLVTWLNHVPNYEEIVVWYTGWKSLFPVEIAQHPSIQEQFTRALDLMNRSLANGGIVDSVPTPAPAPPVLTRTIPPPMMESAVPQGFREVVEYRCAENGILFVPLVNRFQAGRPIFRAGNVLCYFDRQVVFAMVNGTWIPISVQQLIEMAASCVVH